MSAEEDAAGLRAALREAEVDLEAVRAESEDALARLRKLIAAVRAERAASQAYTDAACADGYESPAASAASAAMMVAVGAVNSLIDPTGPAVESNIDSEIPW